MTKDFIAIARNRRLVALTEVRTRQEDGASITRIHTLPDLTPKHVDAVFRTTRKPQPVFEAAQLAA